MLEFFEPRGPLRLGRVLQRLALLLQRLLQLPEVILGFLHERLRRHLTFEQLVQVLLMSQLHGGNVRGVLHRQVVALHLARGGGHVTFPRLGELFCLSFESLHELHHFFAVRPMYR